MDFKWQRRFLLVKMMNLTKLNLSSGTNSKNKKFYTLNLYLEYHDKQITQQLPQYE